MAGARFFWALEMRERNYAYLNLLKPWKEVRPAVYFDLMGKSQMSQLPPLYPPPRYDLLELDAYAEMSVQFLAGGLPIPM